MPQLRHHFSSSPVEGTLTSSLGLGATEADIVIPLGLNNDGGRAKDREGREKKLAEAISGPGAMDMGHDARLI